MKMRLYILSLFVVLSAHGRLETFNNSEVREWTNRDNKVVRGKLVKYDRSRNSVYIARPLSEGGSFWYALNKLSADDAVFVNDEVANLNKVVLPENLYNDAYFNRSSYAEWKWYDSKYLVIEDPVVFNWSERRSRFRTTNVTGWMTRPKSYEFGTHLRPRQRRKGFAPSHWNRSITNFSAILRQYGVSERDLAKLKWFYSKEDWISKTSVIFRKFGIEHRTGPYNYKRVKESIENGMPLLAWYTNSLGHEVMSVITCYYKDERKNAIAVESVRKVYYIKLPRK